MEAMQEIYPDIERQVMPYIQKGAQRLAAKAGSGLDMADIVQMGREVTWEAIQSYDVNRAQGDIERYVARCLRNAYASYLAKMKTKRRTPRVAEQRGDGTYELRPLPPIPASSIEGIWEWHADTGWTLDPEKVLIEEDFDGLHHEEMDVVRDELDDLHRFVLDCLLDPPKELMDISVELGGNVNEAPRQIAIVKWLDPLITKNQMDNIMREIRRVIVSQVEFGLFSPRFGKIVLERWTEKGTRRR